MPLWHLNSRILNWYDFSGRLGDRDKKYVELNKKIKIMTLVKYSDLDFRPTSFSSILDNFFNETNGNTSGVSRFRPGADVIETEKGFEIEVALPGIEKKDINIDVNEGTLTISGERRLEDEKEGRNYYRVETRYGSFSRSFKIPELVDVSKIDASYKNGILKVDLPKDEKKALKTSIKVK